MLKFRQPRNAYDLLGLPWTASPVQIRARYRQLVRHYQKEAAIADLVKDERYRQWANSYLLLTGSERRDYDGRLRQTRGMEQPPDLLSQLSAPRRLLIEAEVAFVRRRLNEAAELIKEVVKQDNRNGDAYALLGDIYREQSNYQNALTMYNYAIQFDPNNRRYWQLLEEVSALREGRAISRRYSRERPTAFNRPASAWVGVGLALIFVELSLVYLQGRWGPAAFFNIPVNLIYAALGDGFLMGLVLAATAIIGPMDDELLWYQVAGMGTETTPLGVFIALPGIVFFWAAPIFYAFIGWLDDYFSLSVVISLLACALVTVSLGLLCPAESRTPVFLLAGDFVYFGFLWGWLVGSIRRRVFEH
jgi:tetratricopeptide (TPR) repeat protein